MKWYVMFVRSGKEDVIYKYIKNMLQEYSQFIFELLVPKREIKEYKAGETRLVCKTVFPGYIFIYTDAINHIFIFLRSTLWHSDLVDLLRMDESFYEISWRDMSPILALTNKEGIIKTSTVFIEQDKVVIIDGSLVGFSGIVKKINQRKGRAKIQINLLNEYLEIDVAINCLQKMDGRPIKNIILFN